ncbi:desulfoferrodoxin family protein [Peptacetobacter sp.]|uniref:desulfoferrodoxin family protein n=1 Tax=Peptacetobacter sp. TaxID=2991975 RepID=UPI00261B3D4B|nr:desulfoferrodoxin family protein [Peptacetobacter sp.]
MAKFYLCEKCKKIVEVVHETPVPLMCCGQKMTELVANTEDAATEKHVPVVSVEGNKVKIEVGSVEHPMMEKHYIMFIVLETNKGIHKKYLNPGEKPVAEFALLEDEKPVIAHEYCNLHGLWSKEF